MNDGFLNKRVLNFFDVAHIKFIPADDPAYPPERVVKGWPGRNYDAFRRFQSEARDFLDRVEGPVKLRKVEDWG